MLGALALSLVHVVHLRQRGALPARQSSRTLCLDGQPRGRPRSMALVQRSRAESLLMSPSALQCMRLIGLAQSSGALTLGFLDAELWPVGLLVFALSWVGYVEASERLRGL